jgi:uncharacterized protein
MTAPTSRSVPEPAGPASWEQEAAPFWSAAAEGRLILQRCDNCGSYVHYPRSHCPRCLSSDLEWCESAGDGTVYSFTVVHRAAPGAGLTAPYVVALIELDGGVRLLSNVVGSPVDDVSVGMRVAVRFELRGDRPVPVFVAA